MQGVAVHASKMATVVTAALGTITVKAVNAGLALGKSLVLDPIRQGFQEYGELLTKQNVIQNATGKSAAFVKQQLNVLNTYSDKTILQLRGHDPGFDSPSLTRVFLSARLQRRSRVHW